MSTSFVSPRLGKQYAFYWGGGAGGFPLIRKTMDELTLSGAVYFWPLFQSRHSLEAVPRGTG